MFKRAFSQVSKRSFQKDIIYKSVVAPSTGVSPVRPASPSVSPITVKPHQTANSSNGATFKTFAEYRLKVTNQSPLAVRSKTFNENLRQVHHS
ncbi:hypothetical protein KGF56_001508 [Candida oxycetoniae]|uniref:Uncharacterized protein n=1 Tax=Candida oxycetoniae TaxID=497107 RepID=A0AAI9SZZ7_9ASCO|nr:uncharacterized protein KGF56_001508 [Candida oxycetoniae]KAI3405490.1 hypothetical protein KGF56_001508 [Candida oxycetoniae]